MENNEYTYPNSSQEEIPEAPTYTTATRPDPATKVRTVRRHRFSTAARVCMWIVGSIAGLTVIFTCVLVWISGLQFLGILGTKEPEAPAQSETQGGDVYNFYVYDDTFGELPADGIPDGGLEDYFDDFFAAPENGGEEEDDGNAQPQSGTPGLGITIMALELQFAIDDKYTAGLVIDTIEDYSSFVGTKVRVNDMIVAAEGEPTPTPDALKSHFADKAVGDEITLTIARYESGVATVFDVTVKLIEMQN